VVVAHDVVAQVAVLGAAYVFSYVWVGGLAAVAPLVVAGHHDKAFDNLELTIAERLGHLLLKQDSKQT